MEAAQHPPPSSMRNGQLAVVCVFFSLIFIHILLTWLFPWVLNQFSLRKEKNEILVGLRKEMTLNTPATAHNTAHSASLSARISEETVVMNHETKFELKVKLPDNSSENNHESSLNNQDDSLVNRKENSREKHSNKYFELRCSSIAESANLTTSDSKVTTKKIASKRKIIKPIYIQPPPSATTSTTAESIDLMEICARSEIHSIKQAQNEEYKRSLEIDLKNRMEKERLTSIEIKQNDYILSFHARRDQFIPIEEPHHEEIDIVNIAIKYQTTQKKVNRRFRRWNKVSDLLNFIERNKDCPIYTTIEVSVPKFPYSKKIIDNSMENLSLGDAGIENNSIVWVHTIYDINTIGE